MKIRLALITCLAILFSQSPIVYAASPVGKIEKSNGTARASGPTGNRTISTGSSVFLGDTIKTGGSVDIHVRFSDQTKLVIGPRSSLKIDQFILKSGNSASKFAIAAARGTFRFISGKSAKSAYKISTRSATIGIRGTGFDFVEKNGASVVLYNGSLIVCIKSNCRSLTKKCQMVRQTGSKLFKSTTGQLPPNAYFLTFPYIVAESRLLPSYRLGAKACDGRSGGGPEGGNSNGNNSGSTGGGGNKGGASGGTT